MIRRLATLLPLVLLLVLTAAAGRASAARHATATSMPGPVLTVRRFALVVGANDGGQDRVVLRYANSDAATMSSVLKRLGGVGGGDHESLNDPTPAELELAFQRISQRIRGAKRAGQHIQFVFYYSGHSDEEGLLLGGERVGYKELRQRVQKVPADVRIAVLDSCASGAFTRLKGGTKRAPFMVGASAEVKGHAFLTSSSVDEAAQESDRIGGSFFTHYFTTGLQGAADLDGDRLITLSEAYQFAFDETLARTEATRGGAQHAAYDIQLAGSGDLIMTDLRQTTARLELAPGVGGRVSVRNGAGDLAAELYKPPGSGAVSLALEPGHYQISVDDGEDLWRAQMSVTDGSQAVLEPDALRLVKPEATVQRGDAPAGPPAPAEPEYHDIPFNVGLFPPLSINGQANTTKKIRNTASLAVVWSRSHGLSGIAAAMGGTVVSEKMHGAQLALAANIAGQAEGLQFSSGFNHAKNLTGVQAAFVNHASAIEHGVQAGLINVGRDTRGGQLGLVVNKARDLKGAQLSLINVGREIKGAQVGVFNYARSADAQVGLISVTREGGVHPSLWVSDTASINVGLRLPARYTYSFFAFGVQPAPDTGGWQAGFGFGGRIPLPHKLFLDLDLSGYVAVRGFGAVRNPAPLAKLRLTFGWQPYAHLAVFGGPTLNALFESELADPTTGEIQLLRRPGLFDWAPVDHVNEPAETRVRVWPGFAAGVRF